MWQQGKILLEDTFSYTRTGTPWVNAFWLSDLGLYGLWQTGGFFALAFVTAVIAVLLMLIIFRHMDGNLYLNGLLILLAMIGIHPNWSPRPQLMSFLLLAFLDYFLDQHRLKKRQALWVLIPFFAVWGNLHGGFIWGVLLLASTVVGEVLNNLFETEPALSLKEAGTLSIWSALASLAVALNPNGISLWQLPFQQIDVSLSITEWLSPDFHQFYAHPLLWLLFLLVIGFGYSGKRPSFTDVLKSLGFGYMFFVAQRNMGPFAIIILPVIARHITPAFISFSNGRLVKLLPSLPSKQPSQKFNFIVNTLLVSVMMSLALFNVFLVSLPQRMNEKLPVRAVEWIKENKPSGPMFNSYNWGGYLTWALREYPVFIDGRADLYGNEMIAQWTEINRGTEQGLKLLDTYKVNLIFIEPSSPLIRQLSEQDWKKEYSDSLIVILRRVAPMPE